ncbi:hypothetical protein [Mycobacterium colombiense]
MSNGFNNAAMLLAANAIIAAVKSMHLHEDDPGPNGTADLIDGQVQPIDWNTPTGAGNFSLTSPVTFTGMNPNQPCTWVSLWDETDTIWYGNFQLVGDQTANNAGEYIVPAGNVAGSSS